MSYFGQALAAIVSTLTAHTGDTDSATSSKHHTLGGGGTQAATGNHGHAHSSLSGIDTDSAPSAIHHTVGGGGSQAAAGNHTHTGTAGLRVQGGTASATLGNGTTTTTVTFPVAFSGTPNVVLSLDGNSGVSLVNLAIATSGISASGFTVQVTNQTGGTLTVGIQWIAVGAA